MAQLIVRSNRGKRLNWSWQWYGDWCRLTVRGYGIEQHRWFRYRKENPLSEKGQAMNEFLKLAGDVAGRLGVDFGAFELGVPLIERFNDYYDKEKEMARG